MSKNHWQIPHKSKTPEYMRCWYICTRENTPWPYLTGAQKKSGMLGGPEKKRDRSAPFPESSRIILDIFDGDKVLDNAGIVAKTGLNPRTVWYGLRKLKEQNKIIEKFNWADARKKLYMLKPGAMA
ncbi:MAG: hypothetical protein ABFC78_04850 [Methanoregula sp.]